MTGDISFRTCIADLVFEVHCQHSNTRKLCMDYPAESDSPVNEVICITAEDIEQERQRFLQKNIPNGILLASTPEAWERLHLCRRISEILPKYDRVLFHGSSLCIDGGAVLFTAKSGTGKSTHTRLWRQVYGDRVRMVNDDKPFLHIAENVVTIYGTPWRGKHALGENISVPLKAIYFLNRGEQNRVESTTARELYPLLLQQTYTPDDPQAMAKTLGLVERLSQNVSLLRLYCNMDPEAAEVAYRGMNL